MGGFIFLVLEKEKFMATYSVKFQVIQGNSIVSTSSTTISANNVSEARQKFMYNHTSNNTRKYKIIAVVKTG
jgi:hypothetical protein